MKSFHILLLLNILISINNSIVYAGIGDFNSWEFKTGHEGISSGNLNFTDHSITIEFWMNMSQSTATTVNSNVFENFLDPNGIIINIRANSRNNNALELRFFAKDRQATPQAIYFYVPSSVFVEKWTHFAFVISSTNEKSYLYVNGELYAEMTTPGGYYGNNRSDGTTRSFNIGGAFWSSPKFYGKLADVRVWSVARTANEIKSNFNKNLDGTYLENTGLYLNYKFSSFERGITNDANPTVNTNKGWCNPSTTWDTCYSQGILSNKPQQIVINDNLLSWIVKDFEVSDNVIQGNYIKFVEPETQKMYKNPLNGWVVYGGRDVASDYWVNYDNLSVPGLQNTVKISDYATTMYIRTSWTILNPQEDVYAWETDTKFIEFISQAQQRGLKLAFRVVVDSRDKSYDFSPTYVKTAGALGFTSGTNNARWTPYPDDPIFQEKYTKFVKAFAKKYNNSDIVEFIDGYGLGKWGEGHSMKYINSANRESVFKWIVDLYASEFTKVPLAINYHRLIGAELEWGSPNSKSEELLDYAVNKGFSLRHDAFGMTTYYGTWEKSYAAKWNFKRPIIMEGGWVTAQHNISLDPRGYQTVADVRVGEYDDSKEAKVNMMDFRINEANSWFEDTYYLVRNFITDGGYRLYPNKLSLPKVISNGSHIKISHQWNNLGWGYCPTNIPQWNQKYKVAFGLLNENDEVIATFIDEQTDLSKWIKGIPVNYEFNLQVNNLPVGKYMWALAIVDKTKNNKIGIEISAKGNFTSAGWLKLFEVNMIN